MLASPSHPLAQRSRASVCRFGRRPACNPQVPEGLVEPNSQPSPIAYRYPYPHPDPIPGLAVQISKNWHTGSTEAYWAGFDGSWWTASLLLRLPPNSTIALSLALSYEKYGGIPAWSHAQLSIVGYSDKWLWEQAALGAQEHV